MIGYTRPPDIVYIMSFLHEVVSERLLKLNVVLFLKVASVWRGVGVFSSKARISSVAREKASLGPDMVMSEVGVEAAGERRDSRVSVADG